MSPKQLPIRGCAFCSQSFRPTRMWQQYCGKICRKAAGKEAARVEYVCIYCGMSADTIDHVPPVSIRAALVDLRLDAQYPFVVVRACRECNFGLGDRALWTVEQRREYIAKWLSRRYRKYLEIPEWTQKDLEALDYNLRKMTMHGLAVKALTIKRLDNARRDSALSLPTANYVESVTTLKADEPGTFCKTCKRPTENDNFCSDICSYIATGLYPRIISPNRRERWELIRRILKKLTKQERRLIKISRLREEYHAETIELYRQRNDHKLL